MICGDTLRTLLVERDGWTVYRCEKCGLGVLDPRPGPEELKNLYAENYFDDQYGRRLATGSLEMKRRIGWQLPFHLYHYTPSSLSDLLAAHGFDIVGSKNYHSEYIKNRLRRIPVVSLFARVIAKFYSGTSYAVAARKR